MRKENGDEKVKIIDTISSLIFNIHLNINSFEMKMSFKKSQVLNYKSFFFFSFFPLLSEKITWLEHITCSCSGEKLPRLISWVEQSVKEVHSSMVDWSEPHRNWTCNCSCLWDKISQWTRSTQVEKWRQASGVLCGRPTPLWFGGISINWQLPVLACGAKILEHE